MSRYWICLTLIITVFGSACFQGAAGPVALPQGDEPSPPPLEIIFKPLSASFGFHDETSGVPSCGVPDGRQQVYDPKTGVFHIAFKSRNYKRSAFEVKKVAERFTKPVVFRLTGVPSEYGCLGVSLALFVGGKGYAIEEGALAPGPVDKTLFRVERKQEVVTVEFTAKGQSLLKPGAQISFTVDTGW